MTRTAIPPAGLAQLAGSVILLSSAWPITKVALEQGATPMWFAVGRAGFSGLTAMLLMTALGRLRFPTRRDWPTVLSVGLLQLAGFFAFTHIAIAYVPAGRTTILCNVTTIFIAPLSLLLGDAIPARRWIAAICGVAGAVVLMGPWAIDWTQPGVLTGHIFLLGSAFCFSLAILIVRHHPPHLPMMQLLPWCFLLAAMTLVPLALYRGGGLGAWSTEARWSMLYIGAFAGPLGTWCVMQVSATLSPMVASVGFLMTPAAGLLISTLWLHEPLGPDLLAGSALILAGVACAAWPQRR